MCIRYLGAVWLGFMLQMSCLLGVPSTCSTPSSSRQLHKSRRCDFGMEVS